MARIEVGLSFAMRRIIELLIENDVADSRLKDILQVEEKSIYLINSRLKRLARLF